VPGQPTFSTAASYSDYQVPGANMKTAQVSNASFIVWVILVGVVVPVFILGGLNLSGFKFVFKGR
jgi:hypothetical protein